MTPIQRFIADEDGTATIEFVFIVPIVLIIFMASVESSLYMARAVMLERSVDIVVRDIRLGRLDDLTHTQLKRQICSTATLVNTVQKCVDAMRIWMQPINTANFQMVVPPNHCVDRAQPIDPLAPEPGAEEFAFGSDNDIMLMRICLKEKPMFPSTAFGARLVFDGGTDSSYALVTTTVFVNEPG